ncbi:helix-turn-helix domain-containing protein [Curvibacter gracilis]|uniref:helix-turn-helix domain-containing protein n=1 Tax=Curvibacter gracilis TaxID=230310 RepID=UPI00047F03B4|nr:helix-turn-helix transcriptional regulator [Curvibacter gracilis]
MDIPVAFGLVLKRSRQAAGLSQEALGFEAGLSKNYISLLETGQRQPTLTSLLSLAQAVKQTPSALIDDMQALQAQTRLQGD